MYFPVNVGRHFSKSKNVGRHFNPDFKGLCPNFPQIKTFEGTFAPPTPTPLSKNTVAALHLNNKCLYCARRSETV